MKRKLNSVRLQQHELDLEKQLEYPAKSWLFNKPKEYHDRTNSTFFTSDKEISTDSWPESVLPEMDPEYSPIPFTHTLFVVEFEMNPIYVIHQQVSLKHWILDVLSSSGGMMVFSYIFFSFFCQTIPKRLYEAHVIREIYRVKFNKLLKGLKLNKSETFKEVMKRR